MNQKYSDFLKRYGHEQMAKDAGWPRGVLAETFVALAKWLRQRTTCWYHVREIHSLHEHIDMRRQMYNDLLERYHTLQVALELRSWKDTIRDGK